MNTPDKVDSGSPPVENGKKALAYALAAILFWATVPTAFKISLRELGVLPMLTFASITSAAALLAAVILGKKNKPYT